jgi:hypothetical protein
MSSTEKAKKKAGKSSGGSKKSGKKNSKSPGSQEQNSASGADVAAVLNKAKLPVAAAGAVLVSVAGAATIRKSRHPKSRKGKLLRKVVKNPSPMVILVRGGTRSLRKLAPGS